MSFDTAKNGLRVGLIAVLLLSFFFGVCSAYSNIPNGDFEDNSSWFTSGVGSSGYYWYGYSSAVTYFSTGSYDNSGYVKLYNYVYATDDGEGGFSNSHAVSIYQNLDLTGKNTLYFKSKYGSSGDYLGLYIDDVLVHGYTLSTSWANYSHDVSSFSGVHKVEFKNYLSVSLPGGSKTDNIYLDHIYFDSDFLEPELSLSYSPDPLYTTDPFIYVNLTTENFGGNEVNITTWGHWKTGQYGILEQNSLYVVSDTASTANIFTIENNANWDYIWGEAEVNGAVVSSFNATVYKNYVAYNPDGSYNYNLGDQYNDDAQSLGIVDYYAREIYEDGTIVYHELEGQFGTVTPTYAGGEHGELISVDIIESVFGNENEVLDTLNSTDEFDYIDVVEDNSRIFYDFGDLWGISGYTYFVKLFYYPPYADVVTQVYSQSGYIDIVYPDYFENAEIYFRSNDVSYLVDQASRPDTWAPEVNPEDPEEEEDEDYDDIIGDYLDSPDSPNGPDSDNDNDSPFPDPLENETDGITWPEAPEVPEIIDEPVLNGTNVTTVTDGTTTGYYHSVNESVGSFFAPVHAVAQYISRPFSDVAGSLYVVRSSLGGQDLSESQLVADDIGNSAKNVFPWYFRLFGSVVICLAIISMILRGSNE